ALRTHGTDRSRTLGYPRDRRHGARGVRDGGARHPREAGRGPPRGLRGRIRFRRGLRSQLPLERSTLNLPATAPALPRFPIRPVLPGTWTTRFVKTPMGGVSHGGRRWISTLHEVRDGTALTALGL